MHPFQSSAAQTLRNSSSFVFECVEELIKVSIYLLYEFIFGLVPSPPAPPVPIIVSVAIFVRIDLVGLCRASPIFIPGAAVAVSVPVVAGAARSPVAVVAVTTAVAAASVVAAVAVVAAAVVPPVAVVAVTPAIVAAITVVVAAATCHFSPLYFSFPRWNARK